MRTRTTSMLRNWRRSGLIALGSLAASGLIQAQYCEAGGTNPTYFIQNVSTTGAHTDISNLNSAFSPNGYGDFTDMYLQVEEGMVVNFSIDFQTGTQGVNLWVDWNHDFDFDDQGEKIWGSGGYISSPATGSLTLAPGTPEGTYRMRVRNHWLSGDPSPCGVIQYGEVEDYTLIVGPPVDCFPPVALSVSNITVESADFNWSAGQSGSVDAYQWELRSSGAPGSGANGLAASGNTASTTASATGLEANTAYGLYVRSDCGSGDGQSYWAGPRTFRTACAAIDLPYLENFNSMPTPLLPYCMSLETVEGNPWTTVTAPAGMTGNAASVSYTNMGDPDMESWLFTPGLNLEAGTSYRVTYKFFNNSTMYTERMASAYGPNPAPSDMTYLRYHDMIQTSTVEIDTIELTPTASGVYYFGFLCYSESNQLSLYLDDIKVVAWPTCEEVPHVSLVEAYSDGVDFSWEASESEPADGYIWEVHTDGNPGDPNPVASGSVAAGVTTASASGLDPDTEYFVHVRANCGGGDLSYWVEEPLAFRTLCVSTTVPYFEDFESAVVPGIPNCMSLETISGNPWTTVAAPITAGFTGQAAQVSYTPGNSPEMDSWLFTQGLELIGGTPYRLAYKYANNSTSYIESMAVVYGTGANAASMTNPLADHPAINTSQIDESVVEFTPDADGVYYIGFKCYSIANQFYLYLDDISVSELITCTGTPDPGATTGPNSICAGIPFTVAFENDPGEVGGYSYLWEISADGTDWTDAPGNNTEVTYAATQAQETWYRMTMTCSEGESATSTPLQVAMEEATACYCSSNFNSVSFEYITHVSFAGIDNASAGNEGGPVDYTNLVAQVEQGETVILSVTIEADASEYVHAFIDWNRNGILDDAGEVYTLASGTGLPGPHSQSITVPTDAAIGTTRMRVMLGWNNPTPDPCYSGSYGEAEDYTVQVSASGTEVDCLGETGGPALPGTPCISDTGYGGLWNDDCVCMENVGIEEIAAMDGLDLYPNPAQTELFIATPHGHPVRVKVFDMTGRAVMEKDQATRLDVTNLAPGTYALLIMDEQGMPQARARFVKH